MGERLLRSAVTSAPALSVDAAVVVSRTRTRTRTRTRPDRFELLARRSGGAEERRS